MSLIIINLFINVTNYYKFASMKDSSTGTPRHRDDFLIVYCLYILVIYLLFCICTIYYHIDSMYTSRRAYILQSHS